MLRSRSNTLVSVRRVTERNAGRLTAGVDGEVVLTPKAKTELADRVLHSREPFKALPVRRVYIPKPGGKKRPLGIPTVTSYNPVLQRAFGFVGGHASVSSAAR
jgi:RNA-directed DNA polymerase